MSTNLIYPDCLFDTAQLCFNSWDNFKISVTIGGDHSNYTNIFLKEFSREVEKLLTSKFFKRNPLIEFLQRGHRQLRPTPTIKFSPSELRCIYRKAEKVARSAVEDYRQSSFNQVD